MTTDDVSGFDVPDGRKIITRIDLAALRGLALEADAPGVMHHQRYIAAANPAVILALLDRLAAAERVVEAARSIEPMDIDGIGYCISDAEQATLFDALAAYDRAIAGQQEGTTT